MLVQNGLSGIQIVDNCLIAALNNDIDETEIIDIQKIILDSLKISSVEKVILDLSSVRIIDSLIFNALKNSKEMIKLLGAEVVMVGISPGVASALVELDVDTDSILTAGTMDEGLALLKKKISR